MRIQVCVTIASIHKIKNENLKALEEFKAVKRTLESMSYSTVIDIKLYARSMISRVDTEIAHISKSLPKTKISPNLWRNVLIVTAVLTATTFYLI